MTSRDDILKTLAHISPELRNKFKIKRIGLFGSYARQEQRPDSDIDLLVDFSEDADLFDLAELKFFLEDLLCHRVDIVPERALREELRQSVHADVSYV
nr:nucleotidyltransferase family protein [uncultured Methanoregula sp.]